MLILETSLGDVKLQFHWLFCKDYFEK